MFDVFNEFIYLIDFEIIYSKKENNFRLIDIQEANLGNIESERFENLVDILKRLDAYINDYIVDDICTELSINEHKTYQELINIITERKVEDYFNLDLLILDMLCNLDKLDAFKDIPTILKNTDLTII